MSDLISGALIASSGFVISIIVSFFREMLNNKNNSKIELIRLYGKEKYEGYTELYFLAMSLIWQLHDEAEDKEKRFENIMKKHYFGKVEKYSLYYSEDVMSILDDFISNSLFFTEPELEEYKDYAHDFINKKCFIQANKLKKIILKEAQIFRKP